MNIATMLGLLLAAAGTDPGRSPPPQSSVVAQQAEGRLQIVQMDTGSVVVELPAGRHQVKLTLPAGPYLLRRAGDKDSRLFARTIDLQVGQAIQIEEAGLTLVGSADLIEAGEVVAREGSRRKTLMTWAITSGAVAVASLAAGATLLADAQSRAAFDQQMLALGLQPTNPIVENVQHEQVAGYFLVPIGVALAVTSAVLFFRLPPAGQTSPSWSAGLGPGSVSLSGRF